MDGEEESDKDEARMVERTVGIETKLQKEIVLSAKGVNNQV